MDYQLWEGSGRLELSMASPFHPYHGLALLRPYTHALSFPLTHLRTYV